MADTMKQEVLAIAQTFIQRYNDADFNGMMQCFTEDTVWFPPNSDPAVGRKDCSLVATGFHSSGGLSGTFASTNMYFERLGDDYADAMEFVDVHNATGEVVSYIKQWLLFKRVKGKWLIHRFAYSPRTKPAGAK